MGELEDEQQRQDQQQPKHDTNNGGGDNNTLSQIPNDVANPVYITIDSKQPSQSTMDSALEGRRLRHLPVPSFDLTYKQALHRKLKAQEARSVLVSIPRRTIGNPSDQMVKVQKPVCCSCRNESCLSINCLCFRTGMLCSSQCGCCPNPKTIVEGDEDETNNEATTIYCRNTNDPEDLEIRHSSMMTYLAELSRQEQQQTKQQQSEETATVAPPPTEAERTVPSRQRQPSRAHPSCRSDQQTSIHRRPLASRNQLVLIGPQTKLPSHPPRQPVPQPHLATIPAFSSRELQQKERKRTTSAHPVPQYGYPPSQMRFPPPPPPPYVPHYSLPISYPFSSSSKAQQQHTAVATPMAGEKRARPAPLAAISSTVQRKPSPQKTAETQPEQNTGATGRATTAPSHSNVSQEKQPPKPGPRTRIISNYAEQTELQHRQQQSAAFVSSNQPQQDGRPLNACPLHRRHPQVNIHVAQNMPHQHNLATPPDPDGALGSYPSPPKRQTTAATPPTRTDTRTYLQTTGPGPRPELATKGTVAPKPGSLSSRQPSDPPTTHAGLSMAPSHPTLAEQQQQQGLETANKAKSDPRYPPGPRSIARLPHSATMADPGSKPLLDAKEIPNRQKTTLQVHQSDPPNDQQQQSVRAYQETTISSLPRQEQQKTAVLPQGTQKHTKKKKELLSVVHGGFYKNQQETGKLEDQEHEQQYPKPSASYPTQHNQEQTPGADAKDRRLSEASPGQTQQHPSHSEHSQQPEQTVVPDASSRQEPPPPLFFWNRERLPSSRWKLEPSPTGAAKEMPTAAHDEPGPVTGRPYARTLVQGKRRPLDPPGAHATVRPRSDQEYTTAAAPIAFLNQQQRLVAKPHQPEEGSGTRTKPTPHHMPILQRPAGPMVSVPPGVPVPIMPHPGPPIQQTNPLDQSSSPHLAPIIKPPQHNQTSKKRRLSARSCNCVKSKCLKVRSQMFFPFQASTAFILTLLQLYCDCFNAGVACGLDCGCVGCENIDTQVVQFLRELAQQQKNKPKDGPEGTVNTKATKTNAPKKTARDAKCTCTRTKCLKVGTIAMVLL